MSLTGKRIKNTYLGLLTLNDTNQPIGVSAQRIRDGAGNLSTIALTTERVIVNGNALPTSAGTNGQFLRSDGAGGLVWASAATDALTEASANALYVPLGSLSALSQFNNDADLITSASADIAYIKTPEIVADRGQVLFNVTNNTYEADSSVIIGDFVFNSSELNAAQTGVVDQEAVFNTWYRYTHNSAGPVFPFSNDLNNLQGEQTAWTFNTSAQLVKNTTNSVTTIGAVSLVKSDQYIIDAQIKSSSADDDIIGLTIAFVTEGIPNTPGYQEHTLTVHRNAGGLTQVSAGVPGNNLYKLAYNLGKSSTLGSFNTDLTHLLPDKIHFKNGSAAPNNLGWVTAGVGCRLKVERTGDSITVTTSELGTTALLSATAYTFSLTDNPLYEKFRTKTRYGFVLNSQAFSSWDASIITGNIYSLFENKTYEFNGTTWVNASATVDSEIGLGRIAANPTTNRTFFIRGPNDYPQFANSNVDDLQLSLNNSYARLNAENTFTNKAIFNSGSLNNHIRLERGSGTAVEITPSTASLLISVSGSESARIAEKGPLVYDNAQPSLTVITREKGDARYLQNSGGTLGGDLHVNGNLEGWLVKAQFVGSTTQPSFQFDYDGVGVTGFYGSGGGVINVVVASADVARFEVAGATVNSPLSVITREKGDARYLTASSASSGFVTLATDQTITGFKTFSKNVVIASALTMNGESLVGIRSNLSVSGAGFFDFDILGATTSAIFRFNRATSTGNSSIIFYRGDGTVTEEARIDSGTGTVAGATTTVITREKGDARYIQLNTNVLATRVFAASTDTAALPGYTWNGDANTGVYRPTSDVIGFTTGGTENARMTGTTTLIGRTVTTANTAGLRLDNVGYAIIERNSNTALTLNRFGTTPRGTVADFRTSNNVVGSISVAAASTGFNTTSDHRVKANYGPILDAETRLRSIPVYRGEFTLEPGVMRDYFIAHELSEFIPEAVTGVKDAVDEENNPIYQGVDQSKVVPLLVAALQKAFDRIDELENRLNGLI